MKNIWRFVIIGILAIIAFKLALGIIASTFAMVFKILIPLALLGAVLYGLYSVSGGKALKGRNGKYLP